MHIDTEQASVNLRHTNFDQSFLNVALSQGYRRMSSRPTELYDFLGKLSHNQDAVTWLAASMQGVDI
jgi:hypothetical protein